MRVAEPAPDEVHEPPMQRADNPLPAYPPELVDARLPPQAVSVRIVVDREGHKPMVIGDQGERIKRIASESRVDLEKLFGSKVYLELFVKVRGGWADNETSLRAYGYE